MSLSLIRLRLATAAIMLVQVFTYVTLLWLLSDDFAYAGLSFEAPDALWVPPALLLATLTGAALPSALNRPSDGVLWLLASFLIAPSLAMTLVGASYPLASRWSASLLLCLGFWVLRVAVPPRAEPLRRLHAAAAPTAVVKFLMAVWGLALGAIFLLYGINNLGLSLDEVYLRRLAIRELVLPPGASYLLRLFSDVLSPALLVVGVIWRRPILVLAALLGGLYVFALNGSKASGLLPLLALACVFAFKSAQRHRAPVFGLVLTGIIGFPTLWGVLTGSLGLATLFPRRMGLVPARLTIEYLNYTETHGHTLFTQHLLKWLIPEDQRQSIGRRVGDLLSAGDGLNANANAWADAFVSAGVPGVVLSSLAMALILHLFNRVAALNGVTVVGPIAICACFNWVNGYLPTSLLTGGVLLALLLSRLLPPHAEPIGQQSGTAPLDHKTGRGWALGAGAPQRNGA